MLQRSGFDGNSTLDQLGEIDFRYTPPAFGPRAPLAGDSTGCSGKGTGLIFRSLVFTTPPRLALAASPGNATENAYACGPAEAIVFGAEAHPDSLRAATEEEPAHRITFEDAAGVVAGTRPADLSQPKCPKQTASRP